MNLKYFLSAVMLFVVCQSVQAQFQVVPQSGINWRESVLTVNRFQPANPSHRRSFNCFGAPDESLPVSISLFDLGYENTDSGPLTLTQTLENQSCFQKAGWYDVTVSLLDFAGNETEADTLFTVKPGELSLPDSTLEPVASNTSGSQALNLNVSDRATCVGESLLADGEDECVLEFKLRDRFGNVITPDQVTGTLNLELPAELEAPNLDANNNPYGAFLAGLYFDDHVKSVTFDLPQEQDKIQVGLRAYVPSLEFDNGEADLNQSVQPQAKPVNVEISYLPEAENRGRLTINKTVNPVFNPLVSVMASIQDTTAENYTLLPLNRTIQLPLMLSSRLGKELPRRVSLDWAAPNLEPLALKFEAANDNPASLRDLVSVEQNPEPYNLGIALTAPPTRNVNNSFRLQPIITYLLKIKEENALVRYPLSITQDRRTTLLPPFRPSQIIASLEQAPVSDDLITNNNHLTLSDMDKIRYSDWRRKVNRNFINLIRGIPPRIEANEFNLNEGFAENDIAYFRGVDLRITGNQDAPNEPIVFNEGQKTIIVEDGNVIIDQDINYGSATDSLGVIVINSRSGDLDRGNLFIGPTVNKFVGNYFLDGALASSVDLNAPNINNIIENREATPNQNLRAPLAQQLVLEGALISRNTQGGADLSPAIGPNGQRVARELALIYDLNYVRRYEPPFDIDGFRISDADNKFCFKPNAELCYANPAPFILQNDGRLEIVPPPGFGEES